MGKSIEYSGNPVLRSASFHGPDMFSQDDESDAWEQKSLHYQPVDDCHKLPQPPAFLKLFYSKTLITMKTIQKTKFD
ncbi:Hypothetical protein CINCED_3A000608 [Cinara cedri]|uniref:Uncharacterized protein n=1 Tax=Cinara cedri TaxID=506608 RepID=A0A5E4N216_9HEMI|nr:Hypothetical protein CINCED_3A000608 [Cinara cedri]